MSDPQTFTIPTGPSTSTSTPTDSASAPPPLHIRIASPARKGADLGDLTWSSSLVLARQLHLLRPRPTSPSPPSKPTTTSSAASSSSVPSLAQAQPTTPTRQLQPRRQQRTPHKLHKALELGSGTGLVGIACAAVWPAHVTLTDFPNVVPNLSANIALNVDAIDATRGAGSARAAPLDWREPVLPGEDPAAGDHRPERFRTVLAADTIYDPAHPPLLLRVVAQRLERSRQARLLVAYPLRVAYLDEIRAFWEGAEGLGLVCEREGREEVGGEWDDERTCEWCVWRWGEGVELEDGGTDDADTDESSG